MKQASEIIEWGKLKPYFDKTYQFNTIDIETIDNKLFKKILKCITQQIYLSTRQKFQTINIHYVTV